MKRKFFILIISLFPFFVVEGSYYNSFQTWMNEAKSARNWKWNYHPQDPRYKYFSMIERSRKVGWQFFQAQFLTPTISIENLDSLQEPTDLKIFDEIRDKLMSHPKLPKGIRFGRHPSHETIISGLCTSICFDFLDSYLEKPTVDHMENICRSYSFGVEKPLGTAQAVFNTIEVTEEVYEDMRWAKLQAMGNLYDLILTPLSGSFSLYQSYYIESFVEQLDDGTYLIRMLNPERWKKGGKGEKVGHTLILIIKEGVKFFFDPNFGLAETSAETIERVCRNPYYQQRMSELRFYKVKRNLQ